MMDEWWRTASKADLKKIVAEAANILRYGPCSKTSEDCPGCSQEWLMAAGLLMYGPSIKEPLETVEAPEEPPACC